MPKRKTVAGIALTLAFLASISACVHVDEPTVREGRFNFSVTYEFDGETKTISGIYECKYAGTSFALDGGAHRSWEGRIKGDEVEDRTVIGTTENGDTIELVLALIPEYFMDGNRADFSNDRFLVRS